MCAFAIKVGLQVGHALSLPSWMNKQTRECDAFIFDVDILFRPKHRKLSPKSNKSNLKQNYIYTVNGISQQTYIDIWVILLVRG